jgi:hypothetical protein
MIWIYTSLGIGLLTYRPGVSRLRGRDRRLERVAIVIVLHSEWCNGSGFGNSHLFIYFACFATCAKGGILVDKAARRPVWRDWSNDGGDAMNGNELNGKKGNKNRHGLGG